jgi:MFS family permease
LANLLINYFKTPTSVGVWQACLVMGVIYFVFMMIGAFAYRVSPNGRQPEGWTPPANAKAMISTNNVHLEDAHKTPQFWLLWMVLCMNVSAGIGVLAMASPMLQEIFGGALIGSPEVGFAALDTSQKAAIATIAAGFVGLLSLFNIGGRFFWASLSDHIGRKRTYYTFFLLAIVLYALAPSFAHMGSRLLFVAAFCVILTMYGGGFATIPAYLADMFGPQFVGAIHGRLLTAWSTAGVVGPLLVGYIRDAQLQAGVERALVYDRTMYILAGLLVVGLICNLLIRPVDDKWHLTKEEAARLQAESVKSEAAIQHGSFGIGKGGLDTRSGLFWAFVSVPLLWGVWMTLQSAIKIF